MTEQTDASKSQMRAGLFSLKNERIGFKKTIKGDMSNFVYLKMAVSNIFARLPIRFRTAIPLLQKATWPEIYAFRRNSSAMQLSSSRTFQPRPSPKESIPYSSAAMRQDLQRVRDAWADCQATRDRDEIYGYLIAVYALVAWWTAEGREVDRARRALRLQRLKVSDREDPYPAVIRCTVDPVKTDKRTRSKWSRVMHYAAAYKPDSEPLGDFIKRKGGINACAARFSRCLGRGAARYPTARSMKPM